MGFIQKQSSNVMGGGPTGMISTVTDPTVNPLTSWLAKPLGQGFSGASIGSLMNGGGNGTEHYTSRIGGGAGGIPGQDTLAGQLGDRTQAGALNPNLHINPSNLDPKALQGNLGALNALNQQATATGPSAWLNSALQGQKLEEAGQMDTAAQQAAGGNANARAQLAMRGGLSGGAAERLARGGQQDLNAQRQNISNQGAGNRIGLNTQDRANQMSQLNSAVAANRDQNAQQIDINKFNANNNNQANAMNVSNNMAENNANNAWKMTKYQEQMKGLGANMSANAIQNSNQGKK